MNSACFQTVQAVGENKQLCGPRQFGKTRFMYMIMPLVIALSTANNLQVSFISAGLTDAQLYEVCQCCFPTSTTCS